MHINEEKKISKNMREAEVGSSGRKGYPPKEQVPRLITLSPGWELQLVPRAHLPKRFEGSLRLRDNGPSECHGPLLTW